MNGCIKMGSYKLGKGDVGGGKDGTWGYVDSLEIRLENEGFDHLQTFVGYNS